MYAVQKVVASWQILLWVLVKEVTAHVCNTQVLLLRLGRFSKFALAATQLALLAVGTAAATDKLVLQIPNTSPKVAAALLISALLLMP
jgi:hypothetical protein